MLSTADNEHLVETIIYCNAAVHVSSPVFKYMLVICHRKRFSHACFWHLFDETSQMRTSLAEIAFVSKKSAEELSDTFKFYDEIIKCKEPSLHQSTTRELLQLNSFSNCKCSQLFSVFMQMNELHLSGAHIENSLFIIKREIKCILGWKFLQRFVELKLNAIHFVLSVSWTKMLLLHLWCWGNYETDERSRFWASLLDLCFQAKKDFTSAKADLKASRDSIRDLQLSIMTKEGTGIVKFLSVWIGLSLLFKYHQIEWIFHCVFSCRFIKDLKFMSTSSRAIYHDARWMKSQKRIYQTKILCTVELKKVCSIQERNNKKYRLCFYSQFSIRIFHEFYMHTLDIKIMKNERRNRFALKAFIFLCSHGIMLRY